MSLTGPVFRVGRRRLAWLDEDGVSLLVPVEVDEGEMLSEAEPRTFSMASQAGGCPLLRIHLAFVAEASLRRILEQAWRDRAPKWVQRSRSGAAMEAEPQLDEAEEL
ncbi:hypothetical protein [Methylobacterium oxalidis]|uniref:Uncharacterized protein n=1 Tax=Methylobacterium oxalidis TaxID=944322 RepID=A0ABQ6DJD4_9HYPH|nr:hypothetical protein [Methylobacterium oxalidis]GLS64607.1 hypothetical protein GCM10007888_29880 [Methylobacterium oxalidis]